MSNRKFFILFTTALFMLVFTACAPVASTDEVVVPGYQAQTQNELIWLHASFAPTLDAHRSNDTTSRDVMRTMLEPLMYFAEGNVLTPLLAESYEQLDDLTWKFTIRQGINFHDGTPFNAEAVKINFERLLNPTNAFPRADFLNMIAEVIVIDDYTIHMITEFPFSPLPAQLTNYAALMISPAAIEMEQSGGLSVAENPIGTGAFKFDSISHGDYIRVVRFDDHWRGVPQLDSIVFRTIPEPATRLAMLETGEAHGINAMLSDVPILEEIPHIQTQSIVTTIFNYIGFNVERPPLDDVRVRQAITMAINIEDILYGIAEGQGVIATSPIAPSITHSPTNIETLPFDPERARELLIEAGHEDGFDINIWYNEGNSVRSLISQLVQSNLADIGINVTISSLEWAAYLEATGAGEHDMFVLAWTGGTGDPDIQVHPLFHTDNIGESGNRSFFSNPLVDALIDEGRREPDYATRSEIYHQLTEILIYEAPVIFLFHPFQPMATNNVENLFIDFSATPDFFRVRLTQ